MKDIVIKGVDTFTTKPFGGNPAGVVTEADGLTEATMQEIASGMKMNLVEIAFVTIAQTDDAAFRIRFFTPSKELDMSGHVTIATCFALIEEERIHLEDGLTRLSFETKIGNIPMEIYFHPSRFGAVRRDDENSLQLRGAHSGELERIMMHQPIYTFSPSRVPAGEIAEVLGIDENEITKTGLPIVTASKDLDWLIIPVQSKETILHMHPDLIKLGMLNRKYGILTNHVFTLDTFDSACTSYSRHFGPAMGLWEDPASANASGGLGNYLLTYGITSSHSMVMQQGKEVASLARIYVEIDRENDETTSVRVGGLAVTSITRKIDLESGEILTV
jgi:trans-2,3-dihydro-3-hydroxyanthranilate isomerase